MGILWLESQMKDKGKWEEGKQEEGQWWSGN